MAGTPPDHPRAYGEHSKPGPHTPALLRITPARTESTRPRPGSMLWITDHPRAYGEHARSGARGARFPGSPPRVRGARPAASPGRGRLRITPARTGSTSRGGRNTAPSPDHPRAYGEHQTVFAVGPPNQGSPPRVRGAPAAPSSSTPPPRITPARTGSTAISSLVAMATADHPRAYGEHGGVALFHDTRIGSPPRVRGARPVGYLVRGGRRITPARTGSTVSMPMGASTWTDHPRAYGEHTDILKEGQFADGSPPRVRGARRGVQVDRPGVRITPRVRGALSIGGQSVTATRITPARTGSTSPARAGWRSTADHPRAYGEHEGLVRTSPPGHRITPARTGSTPNTQAPGRCCADHPRAYGEHTSPFPSTHRHTGSPPRVRGALARTVPFGSGSSDHPRAYGEHA